MRLRSLTVLCAPLLLAAAAACAPSQPYDETVEGQMVDARARELGQAPGGECISHRDISTFTPLSRWHVVLSDRSRSDVFLVTTSLCPGLEYSGLAIQLSTPSQSAFLCETDAIGGRINHREGSCMIRSMERVNSVDEAEAIVAERLDPRRN